MELLLFGYFVLRVVRRSSAWCHLFTAFNKRSRRMAVLAGRALCHTVRAVHPSSFAERDRQTEQTAGALISWRLTTSVGRPVGA